MPKSKRMIRRFGWIPDKVDPRDFHLEVERLPQIAIPESFSLLYKFPPVYDQGELGSCTANALAGLIQHYREINRLPDFTPSRLFIYYNERYIEGTVNTDSGASLRDGMKALKKYGYVPETLLPYDITQFTVPPPKSDYDQAVPYKIIAYHRIPQSTNAMLLAILSGYPFVLGIQVYDNFPMQSSDGIIPLPLNTSGYLGGHAIVAVGFNQTTRMITFRNSWGTGWGDNGYGYLPYAYLTRPDLANDFWAMQIEKQF